MHDAPPLIYFKHLFLQRTILLLPTAVITLGSEEEGNQSVLLLTPNLINQYRPALIEDSNQVKLMPVSQRTATETKISKLVCNQNNLGQITAENEFKS